MLNRFYYLNLQRIGVNLRGIRFFLQKGEAMFSLLMIIFWLVIIAGLIMIILGLPGTFIIVIAALIYGFVTQFSYITIWGFIFLMLIAIGLELIEAGITWAAIQKTGASKRTFFGAVLGSILGGFWGTFTLPIVGTILGVIVGAASGAILTEWILTRDARHAVFAGIGVFVGSVSAKIIKFLGGLAMVGYIYSRLPG
jgi:uncharacterized protein YqgC (DUF456 family)